jgi:hypothetical protein
MACIGASKLPVVCLSQPVRIGPTTPGMFAAQFCTPVMRPTASPCSSSDGYATSRQERPYRLERN